MGMDANFRDAASIDGSPVVAGRFQFSFLCKFNLTNA